MNKTIENTDKLLKFIADKIESDDLDNSSLIQIIELCGNYLNLQTISNYAKSNNISYNGVKKFRNIKKIFGVKLVIDND